MHMQDTRRCSWLLLPLLIAALLAGCQSAGIRSLPSDPTRALQTVESNLTRSESVRCFSQITSEGALVADLRCEHQLTQGGRARIRIEGFFDGKFVDVLLTSDGQTLRMTRNGQTHEAPAGSDLWEGMLIGMTRVGLMHNVALMAMGGMPEGCNGKVRYWLSALDVKAGDDLDLEGLQSRALTFGAAMDGKLAGSVVLWTAVESGLPLERWQKGVLPEGEVRVTEIYRQLEVNGELEWDPAP